MLQNVGLFAQQKPNNKINRTNLFWSIFFGDYVRDYVWVGYIFKNFFENKFLKKGFCKQIIAKFKGEIVWRLHFFVYFSYIDF